MFIKRFTPKTERNPWFLPLAVMIAVILTILTIGDPGIVANF